MVFQKIIDSLNTPDTFTGVFSVALIRAAGTVLGIVATSALTYVTLPVFDPPELKLEHALYEEIERLKPDQKIHRNFSVGVYQYQNNKVYRCRVPNTFVYPEGISPKAGYCAGTYEAPRNRILEQHEKGECVALDPYNVKSDTAMGTIWRNNGMIGESECPIFVDGELWGYLGILYQERSAWIRFDERDMLTPAGTPEEKIAITKAFRDPVQKVLQESGKAHLVLGVHGDY